MTSRSSHYDWGIKKDTPKFRDRQSYYKVQQKKKKISFHQDITIALEFGNQLNISIIKPRKTREVIVWQRKYTIVPLQSSLVLIIPEDWQQ